MRSIYKYFGNTGYFLTYIAFSILLISFSLAGYSEANSNLSEIGNSSDRTYIDDRVIDLLKSQQYARVSISLYENNTSCTSLGDTEGKINCTQNLILGNVSDQDFIIRHKFDLIAHISGYITKSGLAKLKQNPLVKSINSVIETRKLLSESIPLINVDDSWSLQTSGINITGKGVTVCVVDTGVNVSHTAFSGKIVAEKCFCDNNPIPFIGGCCPNGGEEEDNATDGDGHGTHVAGIVTANSSLRGVAPDAKLVVVRVTNSSGIGFIQVLGSIMRMPPRMTEPILIQRT